MPVGQGTGQARINSMSSLVFEGNTWAAYEQLRVKDKRLHKALCKVLQEMLRSDPGSGLGKPEQLKHNLSGLWSKRISQKDRLIYKFDDEFVYVFAIGGHYDR
jgi:toxin YoeB